MINDGINQYAYDAEGRVCAVYSGVTEEFTGYVYDGLGNRIAKGTLDPMKVTLPLTAAACDITKNGFVKTKVYVPGPNGEQLDEADSSMNLQHSNVYANGRLLATTTPDTNLQYAFNDWLGTKRVVASASGTVEETCLSLPYGDELDCNGSDPSEQHFTGKEHDVESGNDYFEARYYSSSMGRFLSPDPVFISAQRLMDPQSLNLYSYVRNNPLGLTDDSGLDFYLACQASDHSGCGQVQNGSDKVWVQGQTVNGQFQATDVDMNKAGDASAGYHDQFGNQYSGSFDENGGVSFTNTATGATSSSSRFIS